MYHTQEKKRKEKKRKKEQATCEKEEGSLVI